MILLHKINLFYKFCKKINIDKISQLSHNLDVKKRIYLFLIIFILLPLPLYAYEDEVAYVKYVLDGDTIVLEDGRHVRYLGINTPEWQEPFSIKAKRFNKMLVNHRKVRLSFDRQVKDGYGRLLSYVFVDNMMVNARLVEEGLAHAFFIPPNNRYNSLFLELQRKAKRQKKGMWSIYCEHITLKITKLSPQKYDKKRKTSPYMRLVNLSLEPLDIGGYSISNKRGDEYVFPSFILSPGYTVIISSERGKDGYDRRGQLKLHWRALYKAWGPKRGVAILKNPKGQIIGIYKYKGHRIFYKVPHF
ncbi:MAG: hypothetical protein D6828_01795 [Nitrospirae bacterium]|nr:MAG: hypothetical protein D6828_01795 [Nitrospirota bacterium]